MRALIPNFITSLNLFFGCIAVLCFLNGYYGWGMFLVFLAAVMDFFDGLAARLLGVSGELGKQLDSLADLISFGFVPGVILYVAFLKAFGLSDFNMIMEVGNYLPLLGFVITIFSALRLAKFNISSNQNEEFKGLPTPANTLLFLFFPLIWFYNLNLTQPLLINTLQSPIVLIIIIFLFSGLLVSNITMISLKFKHLKWRGNSYRYILLLGIVALFFTFKIFALPLSIIWYIALSIIYHFQSIVKN